VRTDPANPLCCVCSPENSSPSRGRSALFLRKPGIILLDEPTNNLDLDARHRLYDAIESWTGVLVVVSHDHELLSRVERIAEVTADAVRLYG
jgi:ATPase subunit of ABC transporter with duplicated ATPase domains